MVTPRRQEALFELIDKGAIAKTDKNRTLSIRPDQSFASDLISTFRGPAENDPLPVTADGNRQEQSLGTGRLQPEAPI